MKEEELKNLVQKSVLKTSNTFTDQLMSKIEEKEVAEKRAVWSPQLVLPGISLALLSLSFFLYKILGDSIAFPLLDFSINKTAFFVPAFFLFLLIVNHTLKLTRDLRNLKNIS